MASYYWKVETVGRVYRPINNSVGDFRHIPGYKGYTFYESETASGEPVSGAEHKFSEKIDSISLWVDGEEIKKVLIDDYKFSYALNHFISTNPEKTRKQVVIGSIDEEYLIEFDYEYKAIGD